MVKTVPMSGLEKLVKGLTILSSYQAAAQLFCEQGYLLVGRTSDVALPDVVKLKLKDLGFQIEERREMFAFNLEKSNVQ
jgi:hypothetical protein